MLVVRVTGSDAVARTELSCGLPPPGAHEVLSRTPTADEVEERAPWGSAAVLGAQSSRARMSRLRRPEDVAVFGRNLGRRPRGIRLNVSMESVLSGPVRRVLRLRQEQRGKVATRTGDHPALVCAAHLTGHDAFQVHPCH